MDEALPFSDLELRLNSFAHHPFLKRVLPSSSSLVCTLLHLSHSVITRTSHVGSNLHVREGATVTEKGNYIPGVICGFHILTEKRLSACPASQGKILS